MTMTSPHQLAFGTYSPVNDRDAASLGTASDNTGFFAPIVPPATGRSLLEAIKSPFRAIARELWLRRDMRTLQELDEHNLHDIGLHRCQIETAVRGGRDRLGF